MAVVFSLDEIDPEVKLDLLKQLTLIPIDKYVQQQKMWGKKDIKHTTPAIPVQMFIPDAATRTVRIPFHVAMERMKEKPNRHKNFPKLCSDGPPKFHGELRDYQKEVVAECLDQLKHNATTTLGLPPGWGKTIAGVYLAVKANGVILILVHREAIGDAWVTTFKNCFPQLVDLIWFVGKFKNKRGIPAIKQCKNPTPPTVREGKETLCGECKGCLHEELIPGIIICMDGRIDQMSQIVKDSVMVTIVDEAHLFCTPSRVECLLCTEPKFVIAETATLNRSNGMASMIKSIVGEEGVFRIPNKPHRVYRIKTGVKVTIEKGPRGANFGDLTHKLINHEERNRQAVDCVVSNKHRKIIIMTRFKEHIPILVGMLEEQHIKVATLYGNQKTYSDSHVLIGTIPKMGVGFDEKNACADFQGRPSDLMLLMTSIAEQDLYSQVFGRVMRSNDPVLFYFEDNIGLVKRHVTNILPWVEETKGTIYELEYEEGQMGIPNIDYSSGIGVVVKSKPKIVIKGR